MNRCLQTEQSHSLGSGRPKVAGPDLRVLALATYPVEAAATRFRISQFVGPLAERGITLEMRPFLNARLFGALYRRRDLSRTAIGLLRSSLRRIKDVVDARKVDAVFVQREAMLFGPPVVEYLIAQALSKPMVLDLDDATYVPYTSPTYGRLAGLLKWFGKTDDLIRWARVVTCGNRGIADYVAGKGTRAIVIPTVVDTDRFCPDPARDTRRGAVPIIGWIGSHSTYPYLESILPALQELARTQPFRLRIVGAGRGDIAIPGIDVECRDWALEREIEDFQSLDVGLYPIVEDEWSVGKSGFKAIQYMAVGVPYVTSPVGACAEIGEPGVTHLIASSSDDWHAGLADLLADADRRGGMGEAGRRHALRHYTVALQADRLAEAIRLAVGRDLELETENADASPA